MLGKCTTLLNQWDELSTKGPRHERLRETARACEKAERSGLLAKTGGLPVILLPIALLVVGGLLIRKSTA